MSDKKPTGMRFNSGKLRFNLIPMDARVELARVYTIGACKYDDNNWLKGMSWMSMVDCAERHFALWQMGQARDPDTGCHHLAQVAWNVLGLLVYEMRGLGTDDRTKLPIDELFNWIDGPAKELNLGLPPKEIEALRAKYAKLREEHKAKEASGSALQENQDSEPAQTKESESGKLTIHGIVANLGGQDTEGYPSYVFRTERGLHLTPRSGDILTIFAEDGKRLYSDIITKRWRYGSLPEGMNESWFDGLLEATLVRNVEPYSDWHFEYWLSLRGRAPAAATRGDLNAYIKEFPDRGNERKAVNFKVKLFQILK